MAVHELEKSGWMDDWFVVRGAPFGLPEGSTGDWRTILDLMRNRKSGTGGRRAGVAFVTGHARLYSPRNAFGDDDCVFVVESEIDGWIQRAEALLDESEQNETDK